MKANSSQVVLTVIVTYQPDLPRLHEVIASVVSQVSQVLLVDNGSSFDIQQWLNESGFDGVAVTMLGDNKGIAVAHNVGIQHGKQIGADYVLLMDHDSVMEPDTVEKLLAAAQTLPNLAAVGPRYFDPRREIPPPFIRVEGLKLSRCQCPEDASIIPVDYLISSGCLIPLTAVEKVGPMREDLFIDYVDIEWGLRAKTHGLQSYGVCAARMHHALGDEPIGFLWFKFPLHSPLRHYYLIRNAVLLYREAWVPLNWKIVDGFKLLLKYGFYSLFAKPRKAHFRMMTLGLWHGMMGRGGKFS